MKVFKIAQSGDQRQKFNLFADGCQLRWQFSPRLSDKSALIGAERQLPGRLIVDDEAVAAELDVGGGNLGGVGGGAGAVVAAAERRANVVRVWAAHHQRFTSGRRQTAA